MLVVFLIGCLAIAALSCAIAEEPEPEMLQSGDWIYVLLEDGTVEITYYTGQGAISDSGNN